MSADAQQQAAMGQLGANQSRLDRLWAKYEEAKSSLRSARLDLEVEQGRVGAAERRVDSIRKQLEKLR